MSGNRTFVLDPFGPVCWGVGPPWNRTTGGPSVQGLRNLEAPSTPRALWSVPQAIPEQFLWCGMVHLPTGGPLPSDAIVVWGIYFVHKHVWMGDKHHPSCIHINARAQGFSVEHGIVMRRSGLLTSPVSCFNVVAVAYCTSQMTQN